MSQRTFNFLMALFGAILFSPAFADTSGTYNAQLLWNSGTSTGNATVSSACAARLPQVADSYAPQYNLTSAGNTQVSTLQYSCNGTLTRVSDGATSPLAYATVNGAYSCPNGGTLSGTVCNKTCPDDTTLMSSGICAQNCGPGEYLDSSGSCKKDCSAKLGLPAPSGYYSTTGDTQSFTVSGCQVRCGKLTGLYAVATGSITGATMTNCTYTGKSAQTGESEGTPEAAPDPNKPKRPADCTGAGMGVITSSSGTLACVPSGSAPPDGKPATKEDKSTTSGTPGTSGTPDPTAPDYKKTDTSTTTGGNGQTTTKTTTTTNAVTDGNGAKVCPSGFTLSSDGNTCTQTSSKTESTADFCAANPTAAACKNSNQSSESECEKNPDTVGCMKPGGEGVDDSAIAPQSQGPSVISPVAFGASSSCPSDIALPKGAKLSFQYPCDLASSLRPIILALAWLSAGLIVIGAFRNA